MPSSNSIFLRREINPRPTVLIFVAHASSVLLRRFRYATPYGINLCRVSRILFLYYLANRVIIVVEVIDMNNDLPKRKHPRLDTFDYSSAGAYFVTICTQDRRCVLSDITTESSHSPANVKYTNYGFLAEQQLLTLKERFPFLDIYNYVIMPNHIHIVFVFHRQSGESDVKEALTDVICAYKSLTAKACREMGFSGKLFQTSFYEHIIRNYDEYKEIAEYIENNPINWYYDELYKE